MISIYCLHNSTNGKNYIGQTRKPLNQRFRDGFGSNLKLKSDIISHGFDNFFIFEIDQAKSREESNIKETYYIHKYESYNSEMGYNIKKIGKCRLNDFHSDDIKCKISNNTKLFMSQMSEEQKNQRKIKSATTQINKGIYLRVGKQRSIKYKGSNNPNASRILVIETGQIFNTFSEALKYYNIHRNQAIKLIQEGLWIKTKPNHNKNKEV